MAGGYHLHQPDCDKSL